MPESEGVFIPGNIVLKLEGVECGHIRSVIGGNATADVISEPPGPDLVVKKHLGAVKYEDIVMQIDISLAQVVYDWIATTLKGTHQPKKGSIILANNDGIALSTLEFVNALISEVDIPAMDARSRDLSFMNLKLTSELTSYSQGGTKVSKTEAEGAKRWMSANFRLQIDGLDCTHVNYIDPFLITSTFVSPNIGEPRDFEQQPIQLNVPNLKVSLSESSAQLWYAWHEDFVIKGNNGADKLKNGTLTFLAQDQTKELAHINFFNLGIFSLAPNLRGEEAIRHVTAEMFCERVEFVYQA